jgi:hypothetical protein
MLSKTAIFRVVSILHFRTLLEKKNLTSNAHKKLFDFPV